MAVRVCVWEKGCRKGVGALLYVSLNMNHSREQGLRAGSMHVPVGRSCCGGHGMTCALHDSACELLQVTGQEWRLWGHGGSCCRKQGCRAKMHWLRLCAGQCPA